MVAKLVYENAISSIFAGWKVKIQGRTTQCNNRFDINLDCKNPCDQSLVTIPLHISFRFDEKCIVRNTLSQLGLGNEERDGGMPIVKGESFTIELECKTEVFSIIINGCHFSDYKHRLPFHTINYLRVDGEVEICDVSFNKTPPPQPECEDKTMTKPKVYEVGVTSVFVGRLIAIDGSVSACTNSFDIDLVHKSRTGNPPFTIPLHLRFHFVEERIIMNTLTDCGWGKEESRDGMPLNKGESFSIVIECRKNEFRISIGGVRFCDYRHRLPHGSITHLRIKGDIPYRQVTFDEVEGLK